ncbi:hypothetical protein D584_05965 [Brucella intermedia M86]|uniref:Uncharacterized protein n=1 Tax=Brucella intermedia M86 TaxID=1234597 RepID=M5K2Z9_9HYPH|nr:hypothetical protein D584_05965 [Brucella intermedia M86]
MAVLIVLMPMIMRMIVAAAARPVVMIMVMVMVRMIVRMFALCRGFFRRDRLRTISEAANLGGNLVEIARSIMLTVIVPPATETETSLIPRTRRTAVSILAAQDAQSIPSMRKRIWFSVSLMICSFQDCS